jgi:restriction system protein
VLRLYPECLAHRGSKQAWANVQKITQKVILIEGEELAQLMIDHGVGVADVNHYVTKRVDQDYFEVE